MKRKKGEKNLSEFRCGIFRNEELLLMGAHFFFFISNLKFHCLKFTVIVKKTKWRVHMLRETFSKSV